MEYIEITISAPEESKEAVMFRMGEMGALGFAEQDGNVIAYFEPIRPPAEICRELLRFTSVLTSSGLDPSCTCSFQVLPDRDWNETWKQNFVPIDVGDNLSIIPSWLTADTHRIPIVIDPGMVFGTGHHETTRTCLSLIEQLAKHAGRKTFLDIGTGTGILAIGAARLGFEKVMAVDIDPLAVDAAVRNVAANGLGNVEVKEGSISSVNGTFDAIVANLLSEILIAIAPEVIARLNPGGTAILSGLLVGQEDAVIAAMSSAGLTYQEKIIDGTWVSLIFRK
jgi:ribosomal protein L11 methyltransferase